MKKFKICVTDKVSNESSENLIQARDNTSMKTFVLKGVQKHVEQFMADPLDFISEVKSLHREAYDLEDFVGWLEQDLDLSVAIADLNNHRFYNKEKDYYTTSYEEGLDSYKRAWEDQLGEEDGEQDFDKYKPDRDSIIEHGNELTSDDYFLEEWELDEE